MAQACGISGSYFPYAKEIITDLYKAFDEELNNLSEDERSDVLCHLSLDYTPSDDHQEIAYDSRAVRLAYLLRYFFAYSREYYLLHRDALKMLTPREALSVCSIGCGACVDRWSLHRLMRSDDHKPWSWKIPVKYYGYDIYDWSRETPDLHRISYGSEVILDWSEGAVRFAREIENTSPDIIIFPKSAMEIRSVDEVWDQTLRGISRHPGQEFCVAISRSQVNYHAGFYEACLESVDIGDVMKSIVSEICDAAQSGGFELVEEHVVDVKTHIPQDRDALTYEWLFPWNDEMCPEWYPGSDAEGQVHISLDDEVPVLNEMITLHTRCRKFQDGICTKDTDPDKWKVWRGKAECKAADRAPCGVRTKMAGDGSTVEQFAPCYCILHFRK